MKNKSIIKGLIIIFVPIILFTGILTASLMPRHVEQQKVVLKHEDNIRGIDKVKKPKFEVNTKFQKSEWFKNQ